MTTQDEYYEGTDTSHPRIGASAWERAEQTTDSALRDLGAALDRDPEEFKPFMAHEWMRSRD